MSIHYVIGGIVALSLLVAAEANGQEPKGIAERFGTNGLARVEVDGKPFYIDTLGNRAFDAYADPNRQSAWVTGEDNESAHYLVIKDGLWGIRSATGNWIAHPMYQHIEVLSVDTWKVTKGGKQTFLGVAGELLPYFDEVGYLDGRRFDVKADGKWGVYDRELNAFVIPTAYDGFDYCGGCGQKSDYVYAQQNGKWGIVDFNNCVRVPLAYEHSHWNGMRSDVWVRSFSREGKPVAVHIPTGREFSANGGETSEILGGGELVVHSEGKYGLVDTLCREVLPIVYDRITLPNANSYLGYHGPYALVEQGGKKGIYASGRGIVVRPEWDEVLVYDDHFVLARAGKYGLYDRESRELIPPSYTGIVHVNDYFYSSGSKGISIFRTRQKALQGLYFTETGVEVPPKFHEIETRYSFGEGLAAVVVGEYLGQEAVFDLSGTELLPLGYEAWEPLDTASARYLKIRNNGRWGLYDTQSKRVVIAPAFDHLRPLVASGPWLLAVDSEGDESRYGAYAVDGTELIPPAYESYDAVGDVGGLFSGDREGRKAVLFDGRSGKKKTLPARYAQALLHTHLALISNDATRARLYSLVEGKMVNDLEFSFRQRYADDGKQATMGEFATNGRAWVRVGNRYGLMDTLGRWVREPLYEQVLDFGRNGIAVGAKAYPSADWRGQAGLIGYQFIDAQGRPITGSVHTGLSSYLLAHDYFVGDYLAIREMDSETGNLCIGLADTAGNVILPPAYDAVEAFNGGRYFLLQKGYKFGMANADGKILLPVDFDNLLINRYDLENGVTFPLLAYQSGEWKYYTPEGSVLPVEGIGTAAWSVGTGLW